MKDRETSPQTKSVQSNSVQTKSVKTKIVQTKNMQTPVYKLKTKRLQITLGNQGYTGMYEERCNRRTICNNRA